jgi:hypothetical protein
MYAWFVQAKACRKARGSRKRDHIMRHAHTEKIVIRTEIFTAELALKCMICKNHLMLFLFTRLFEDMWDYQGGKRAGCKSEILLSNLQKILFGKTLLSTYRLDISQWSRKEDGCYQSADLVPGSTHFRHRVYDDFSGEKVPLAVVHGDFSGELFCMLFWPFQARKSFLEAQDGR